MTAIRGIIAGVLAFTPLPAMADDTSAYVEANLLGIFYHELGHALIDMMGLPIFGQEEDAADVLSIVMINEFYDEETAVSLAYETAFGFESEAGAHDDVVWWDVHGPDLQRYYNLVCLFYGANPEEREDVAQDLGLPEERSESCEEEFDLAVSSWGAVLDELSSANAGHSLRLVVEEASEDGADVLVPLMTAETEAMNAAFKFPSKLTVSVAACGEANAFYDPADQSITMCTEFVEHLRAQVGG